MATYKFTPKDIYDADFSIKMRGYDKAEVDEMLDDVIRDYETYQEEVLKLQEENDFLKRKVTELERKPQVAVSENTQRLDSLRQATEHTEAVAPKVAEQVKNNTAVSNFDILKRLNRLERAVFGPSNDHTDND